MIRFKEYFDCGIAALNISQDTEIKIAITECLSAFANFAFKYPKKSIKLYKEAEQAQRPRKTSSATPSIALRRQLSEPEEALLTHYMGGNLQSWLANKKKGKGITPAANLGLSIGQVLKGQLPVVNATLKLAGVDDPSKIHTHQAMLDVISKADEITPQQIRSYMQSQGEQILPSPELKRIYAIEKLRDIQKRANAGETLSGQDQAIFQAWKTIENRLNTNPMTKIVGKQEPTAGLEFPRDPEGKSSVSPDTYTNIFSKYSKPSLQRYTKENTEVSLNPENAYDYLMQQGMDIVSDEEAELMFINDIQDKLVKGMAWMPKPGSQEDALKRRFERMAQFNLGRAGAKTGIHHPINNPGVIQRLTGLAQPIEYMKTPKGLKPKQYGEYEPLPKWADTGELPSIYTTIDKESIAVPITPQLKKLYDANPDIVDKEILEPAKIAANLYFHNPSDREEAASAIAIGMMQYAGHPEWREKEGMRKKVAHMLARRLSFKGQVGGMGTTFGGMSDDENDAAANIGSKQLPGEKIRRGPEASQAKRKDIAAAISGAEDDEALQDMPTSDVEWFKDLKNQFTQAVLNKDFKAGANAIKDLQDLADEYPPLQTVISNLMQKAQEIAYEVED